MPSSELEGQVALVTGGGRGIGANVARELASAGMDVWVSGRTAAQVESVAAEIGGHALIGDVSSRDDVEHWAGEAAAVDLLVCNAGMTGPDDALAEPDEWWHTFEVNVLGVFLCCRAFAPGMIDRGSGRIVNVASGVRVPAGAIRELEHGVSVEQGSRAPLLGGARRGAGAEIRLVFSISPGLVKTEMTSWISDDAPWTPPECAPRLVRALATGEFDALAGRYLHAEHDPPDQLRTRIAAILADDLNAIRLRR